MARKAWRAKRKWQDDIEQYYIRRCKCVPDDMEQAGNKIGIIKPTGDDYNRVYPRDGYNVCADCLRLGTTCKWIAFKEPIDGWSAVPSKIYKDSYKVYGCPLYIDYVNYRGVKL